jgi:hypothetical protein
MAASEFDNIEVHDGRPVGMKVLVEFSPEDAQRVSELAELAGIPVAQYLKRLVDEAAAARTH